MYIRTKDGVYDTSKGIYTPSIKMWAIGTVTIYDEDILKQADTIEELCDRYVGISNNKPMIIKYEFDEYYDEYGDTYTKEELLMEYDIVYGAIYTGKGLIYVAKVDEDGVLKLI